MNPHHIFPARKMAMVALDLDSCQRDANVVIIVEGRGRVDGQDEKERRHELISRSERGRVGRTYRTNPPGSQPWSMGRVAYYRCNVRRVVPHMFNDSS